MSNQTVEHFSHPHSLTSLKQEQELVTFNCRACERLISEPFHGCSKCDYYLHDECLEAPRSISHPSHPSHHLTLLPFATYSSGRFICDGCGLEGEAFVYSCCHCSFDLHTHCAFSPNTIVLDKHPHKLQLVFDSKDKFRNAIFRCDLCNAEVDLTKWLYYCSDCDYGTHLCCGLSDRWPLKPQVQQNNDATDSDKAQLHHREESPEDHQPTTYHKEGVDVRNDCQATRRLPHGQKCDGRLENLSIMIDEVTEIQIIAAKLQNLLSKTYIYVLAPE